MSQDYFSTSDEIAKQLTSNRARRSLRAAELSSTLSLTEKSIHDRTLSICRKYAALTIKRISVGDPIPNTHSQHTNAQLELEPLGPNNGADNNIRNSVKIPAQGAEETVTSKKTSIPLFASSLVSKLIQISSLVCIINAVCLAGLSAWLMAGLQLCLALVLLNMSRSQPNRFLKKLALVACFALMIIAAPTTANNLTSGLRGIGDQAISGGPESLSYASRFSLWWSAVWMSLGGLAYGAPYTVAEQVLMFWPGPKERLWNDDFPSQARKVRDQIEDAKIKAGSGSGVYKNDLIWQSYCQDDCDVGLALNGGDLTVEIADGGEQCTATARVSVWYKPQYRSSTILGYGGYALRIDQAAYWALQELGWLHPFTLRYRWQC